MVNYSHNPGVWGEQGRPCKQVQNGLREPAREAGPGFLFWFKDGAGQGFCIMGVSSQHPKEGAPGLSHQLAQIRSTEGKVRLRSHVYSHLRKRSHILHFKGERACPHS